MAVTGDQLRISQIGLVARSPEGHAAKGMAIKGHEDLWVEIQAHTFRNWVNEHLRSVGMDVRDLASDLCDGTRLCALVEVLQKRKLRPAWIKKPSNQHQYLENVTAALTAVSEDGIKLVNIDSVEQSSGYHFLYRAPPVPAPRAAPVPAPRTAPTPLPRAAPVQAPRASPIPAPRAAPVPAPRTAPTPLPRKAPRPSTSTFEGNVDIVNGNLKLILGLIWSLIVRYQIGRSKFPPRKLMLAWLKAVLPECRVTNFTTDWNSGIFLSALLDYCEPGLFPHWKHIDPSDSVHNCRTAMELARSQFGVPLVLEPEYLASPFLDELSGMTYLSYFMKENSPGFRATIRWVNSQLKDKHISNFTRDWNDGSVLCDLVSSLGAPARHQPSNDPQVWETNLNNGINSGRKLGVEPLLRAKDMVDSNVEHLGVMAYAAHFQWIPPRTAPSLTVAAGCDNHTTRINTLTNFKIEWLGEEVDSRNITVEVVGPELQRVDCRLSFDSAGGKGTFTPTLVGMHQIKVYNEGEVVKGCPFHIRAMPEVSAITYTGMEPCAVGSIVEVLVNSNGARSGNIEVIATSPTGRERDCPVAERSGVYTATFQPDEAGEWRIAVLHSGELIQGGPFTCFVFDPNGVKLLGLDTPAVPESIFNFTMDARGTGGLGKITIDIVQDKHSLPHTIQRFGDSMYNVSLHTGRPGKYRIYVYFNGSLIKGSPFALRVGTREQMKTERYNSSASKISYSSPSNENHRLSAFNRVNSPRQVSSPVDSHSPSPYGFRVTSPLSSPLRSPVEKSSSPAFRTNISSFEKSSSSAFHINGSPVEKTSPGFRINHSPTVNGLRSPLHSPGFRSSPSPLGSPGARSSPSFQYNTTVDTSSNVKVSSMLSSLNQRRDSWDAILKTQNNSNEADLKVTGDALQLLPLHRASTLHIHSDAPLSQIIVTVTAPSKQQLPVKMTRSSSQQAVAYFTVTEVGEHAIDVKVKDQRVIGAPFRSHAYDSCAIKVGRIPNGTVGQPVEFEIDGSGAGSGNLEILVNGGHVTSFVRNLGNQRFLASFVPHEGLSHLVEMKFNGEAVPGSPWQVAVMSGGLGGGTPKMSVIGEAVRLVPVDQITSFQISALGFLKEDVHANVISPSKRSVLSSVVAEPGGIYRVEFTPAEVGSHLVEVTVAGEKLPAGPLLAKVYNAALIRVTDVSSGVVGQPCQFRVDASQAGEGQLEISINEGEVPNHVTVVGGGRCLVSFTPEHTKPHLIDIKFNGETVTGCPFICSVSDTSRVSVNLSSLELIPVNQVARFHMTVDSSGSAELAVAVTGPSCELPVKVTGNVHSGFTAEFTPREVGPHSISVEYNGHPVSGTPFVAKAYDAKKVYVGPLPQGHVGKPLQFTVDASHAGEGNLEITISAQGVNIPTQVHPQGNAKFAVSFVPIEPVDHVISIYFNKEAVPGSLFIAPVVGDFPLVTGTSLSHAPLGVDSYFTMSNVTGSLDDIEVNVEGPNGQSVPAQVKDAGGQTFKVEFCPRVVGEHKIAVNYRQVAVAGSPFSCKVYDVSAIKVKPVQRGTVGQPVTFLVETSQAGPGNLEVTVNGGRVATSAQAQGPHTYAISFTPRQATTHTVDLRFNGRDVPGSPFSCGVGEAARVVLSGEDKVSVDKPATFVVECEPSVEQPQVQVLSPSRHPVPVTVKPTDMSGRYACTLTTKDVGDHSVEVKLAGGHVEGSPFLIKAYDATKVKVTDINSGTVGKPVYFSINASQAGAGNLEIIVSVNGCNVPNYVQSEGNAKFRVNFKPREAAPHSLSVRFNGEPIPGSPFTCRVLEPGQVSVSGSGVRMTSAGQPALVHVDGASNTCEVTVTSPSNNKLPVKVDRSDNRFTAEFTPVEVGRHLVAVEADGQTVKGSPFACNIYNVSNIKVTGLGPAKVGKPVTFSVDAMEAGEGTLELVISTQQSTVKAEVVACSRGLYDVTFVPHQLSPHFVNITFNEEDVPGSPYRCEVVQLPSKKATATARGEGLNQVVLGTAAYFEINPHSSDHGSLDAQVIGPDGCRVPCTIEKLETGLYRAKYRPVIVGTHSVTVTQRKQPITKQPFTVQVFDPLQVKLTDLSEAFCHRAATFKVDTRGAGSGALSVSIRAAGGEVKHTLRELETPGLYQVVYHPQLAIPHKIHIKYNSMNIAGCPMEVAVTDPAVGRDVCATGLGLYQSRAGRVTHFTIETAGRPAHEFDVVITGPQSSAVPVRCYQQKDGNLMAEFTANNTGVYKIDVLQGSRPVRGSPYHCQVYDATKVKIEALAANSVSVNENISFKLVRKNAGFAELDVTVRSPLGQDLPLSVRSIGEETDLIELCPSLPGNYCFHITYGGDSIPDSPLTFTVVESGVARAWGQGLSRALLDTQACFHVACNGVNSPTKPDVTMDGPEHTSVKCLVTKAQNSGEYEVTYTPNKVGVYDIRISCNGKQIAGSPFRAYVVCVERVRLLNDIPGGRLPLSVHMPTRLTFDVSEAGPGDVAVECKAPHNSTLPVPVDTLSPDRVQLTVTPRTPGPHTLHLSYGGFLLPCSPVQAMAEGGAGGVRVVLTGKGLAGAVCNQQAEFTIDGSQAGPGKPEVSLSGMKNDIEVNLQPIGENVYRATYIPTQPGAYLLNVMWSDRQVKGCPLKVTVTAVCDASRVICSGDGLGTGTVGKDIRSFIDTRAAGPGELSAHCVGPHKVAYCELYDHSDGTFTLNVKPQEAGRHTLTVKYGGLDVPGSPFCLKVSGAPDASKVRVYGPGVEHGVLATFQSRFICDTRGAGAGQLTVRVRGPKGAFRVEMQRESQKDRTILCKFDPTEPGDYRVEIKWAGEHVPGSPFMVLIFDTQEELNRFLSGSQSPGSEVYGSVAYSTGYAHITP